MFPVSQREGLQREDTVVEISFTETRSEKAVPREKERGEGRQEELAMGASVRLKRVNADLPVPLHTRFKAACAGRELQMTEVIRELIEDWTKKHE
jgi:hypothetical protein